MFFFLYKQCLTVNKLFELYEHNKKNGKHRGGQNIKSMPVLAIRGNKETLKHHAEMNFLRDSENSRKTKTEI